MSIKNPYTELLGITADSGRLVHVANPAYPAFNEGVKAANEDWIREIDKHLKQFQGYEYIDNEWWQSLKQSLEVKE